MKRTAVGLIVLIFLAACASSSMPVNAIEGGPGQDITVGIAGIEEDDMLPDGSGTRNYTVRFEVTNLSDHPITVIRIGVMPASQTSQAFQLGRTSVAVNEMIDPGDDHIFDVRMQGQFVRRFRDEESRIVEFRLLVGLLNEETYFYTFEAPVRDDNRPRF